MRLEPIALRPHAIVKNPPQGRRHDRQGQIVEQLGRYPPKLGTEHEVDTAEQTDCRRTHRRRKIPQQIATPHHGDHLNACNNQRDADEDSAREECNEPMQRDESDSP